MLIATAIFIIISCLHLSIAEDLRCEPNVPCSFPFVYYQELHYECINVTDPDNRLWCSTKTHPVTKKHLTGNWKHCDSECGPGTSKDDPRIQTFFTTQSTIDPTTLTDESTQLPTSVEQTPEIINTKPRKYSERPKRSLMGVLDGGTPTPSKGKSLSLKNPNYLIQLQRKGTWMAWPVHIPFDIPHWILGALSVSLKQLLLHRIEQNLCLIMFGRFVPIQWKCTLWLVVHSSESVDTLVERVHPNLHQKSWQVWAVESKQCHSHQRFFRRSSLYGQSRLLV